MIFPTYIMAPGSHLFFERPVVDTEFDMTDVTEHSLNVDQLQGLSKIPVLIVLIY
jgi:hypothetical protein